MKATRLADLCYSLDINPFYIVLVSVFIYPLFIFIITNMLLEISIWWSLLIVIVLFALASFIFILYFHRNPTRIIDTDENMILSPADGKVVYVKKFHNGNIKSDKHGKIITIEELMKKKQDQVNSGFIIGIEMRLFDVHIIRSPVSGKIFSENHISGNIISMSHPDFELINERETVELESDTGLRIAVIEIASFLARTIKSYVHNVSSIKQGSKIGIIRFGSQVDLVIFSNSLNLLVKKDDRAYAGITKIAEICKK